eukprot:Sspe_Gene.23361::Locus_9071_Transcript_1_1_Confidence_1.000_Length_1862::g.23361::m.23361
MVPQCCKAITQPSLHGLAAEFGGQLPLKASLAKMLLVLLDQVKEATPLEVVLETEQVEVVHREGIDRKPLGGHPPPRLDEALPLLQVAQAEDVFVLSRELYDEVASGPLPLRVPQQYLPHPASYPAVGGEEQIVSDALPLVASPHSRGPPKTQPLHGLGVVHATDAVRSVRHEVLQRALPTDSLHLCLLLLLPCSLELTQPVESFVVVHPSHSVRTVRHEVLHSTHPPLLQLAKRDEATQLTEILGQENPLVVAEQCEAHPFLSLPPRCWATVGPQALKIPPRTVHPELVLRDPPHAGCHGVHQPCHRFPDAVPRVSSPRGCLESHHLRVRPPAVQNVDLHDLVLPCLQPPDHRLCYPFRLFPPTHREVEPKGCGGGPWCGVVCPVLQDLNVLQAEPGLEGHTLPELLFSRPHEVLVRHGEAHRNRKGLPLRCVRSAEVRLNGQETCVAGELRTEPHPLQLPQLPLQLLQLLVHVLEAAVPLLNLGCCVLELLLLELL